MDRTLVVQELATVVATKNNNPALLTYDFLKYSNIIPIDWELAKEPINTNQASQVIFRNGVNIVAQPDRILFAEAVGSKELAEIQVAAIARKYVETLPNIEYQAVGNNLRGYVTAQGSEGSSADNYIVDTLLASGPWRHIGNDPVKATLQLAFSLDRSQLSLNISDGTLYLTEEEVVPIVLFTGTFSYIAQGSSKAEQLQSLYTALSYWRSDLETYQDIINTKFLATASEVALQDAPQLLTAQL